MEGVNQFFEWYKKEFPEKRRDSYLGLEIIIHSDSLWQGSVIGLSGSSTTSMSTTEGRSSRRSLVTVVDKVNEEPFDKREPNTQYGLSETADGSTRVDIRQIVMGMLWIQFLCTIYITFLIGLKLQIRLKGKNEL